MKKKDTKKIKTFSELTDELKKKAHKNIKKTRKPTDGNIVEKDVRGRVQEVMEEMEKNGNCFIAMMTIEDAKGGQCMTGLSYSRHMDKLKILSAIFSTGNFTKSQIKAAYLIFQDSELVQDRSEHQDIEEEDDD